MIPEKVAQVRDILKEVWGVTDEAATKLAWRIYKLFEGAPK